MEGQILDHLDEGIVIIDADYIIRFCNLSLLKHLEYQDEALIGFSIDKILKLDFQKEESNGSQIGICINMQFINSRKKVINVKGKIVKEQWKGERCYVIIIKAFDTAPYDLDSLKVILENLPCGIWFNKLRGEYQYINQNVIKLHDKLFDTKTTVADYIGHTGMEIWNDELIRERIEHDDQMLEMNKMINENREIIINEKKFSYNIMKMPILGADGKHVEGVVCIQNVLANGREMEEVLLKSLVNPNINRKQYIEDVAEELIKLIDADSIIIYRFNKAQKAFDGIWGEDKVKKYVNLSKAIQIPNSEVEELIHSIKEWDVQEFINAIGRDLTPYFEIAGINYIMSYPIECEGETIGCLVANFKEKLVYSSMERKIIQKMCSYIAGVIRSNELVAKVANEIQKREAAEEALKLEELKNEFLANISHELRTPLNIIYSMLQLAHYEESHTQWGEIKDQYHLDLEKIDKYRKVAKQNVLRLLRLINNIIDISKMQAGSFDVKMVNCNIVSVIEEITISVIDYVKSKQLEIIFDTQVEEVIMTCNPESIERIMLNLLANALKYTEKGKIYVNIEKKNETLAISVLDTGVGIPKDKQKSIFNRFEQVDTSFTRICEGSGMGLALVKALAQLHHGTVEVESDIGKGSKFIVCLPIVFDKSKEFLQHTKENIVIDQCSIEFSDIYNLF